MIDSGAYRDLSNAYVTNPNWVESVDINQSTHLHTQAQETSDSGFRGFVAKHTNVNIGLNLRSDRWAVGDLGGADGSASGDDRLPAHLLPASRCAAPLS